MAVIRIIPELRSHDVPATEDLYCNVLGLEIGMSDEDSGFRSFSSPDNPAAQIIVNDNAMSGCRQDSPLMSASPARSTPSIARSLTVACRSSSR